MHDFEYAAPDNLKDALALKSGNSGANLLAGGTDLLVFMRAGRKRPGLVIDAKKIPELTRLILDDAKLVIGAAVSCRRVYEDREIISKFPALEDCTNLIGSIQIQGRATIGGNLCNAAPSADTIPALIAYGAIANLISNEGTRDLPVEEICTGPGQTCIDDKEILVSVTLPVPPANSGAKFLRFIPRNEMDIAVANAAAYVELDEPGQVINSARIAIGAVAPTPLNVKDAGAALSGKPVTDELIQEAADIARNAAAPINDMRGTVEHRLQLAEVLTKRVLQGAIARAKGDV